MTSINLVPRDCLERRQRRGRVEKWVVVLGLGVIGVLMAALNLTLQDGHLRGYRDHHQELEGRLAELQRQRTLLLSERATLFARAELLVAPLSSDEIPAGLAQLTREAPDGIVLTRVELGNQDRRRSGSPNAEISEQPIAIEGYGQDEAQIHSFARIVQGIPAWETAQLNRIYRKGNDGAQFFTIQRGGRR